MYSASKCGDTSNRTGAQHEALSTYTDCSRASAHTKTCCLIPPKPHRYQPLQHPHQASASNRPAPFRLQPIPSHPTQSVPDPSAPAHADSKYIGFREGGFLQVAVSEAPPKRTVRPRTVASRGAPDTALRHLGTLTCAFSKRRLFDVRPLAALMTMAKK